MVIVAAGVAAMMLRADMTAITGPLGTASPLMTTTGDIVPTIPVIAAMLIGTSGAIDTNGAIRRGECINIPGDVIGAARRGEVSHRVRWSDLHDGQQLCLGRSAERDVGR